MLSRDVESTVTCQATPGSHLANLIREKIGTTEKGNRRIVQEESGLPVTIGLKKTNPFLTEGCQYGDPHCIAKGDKDCGRMGVVYAIKCKTCYSIINPEVRENPQKPGGIKSPHYIGMSACSLHSRMLDHRTGQKRGKSLKNPLVRHDKEAHNGVKQEYSAVMVHKEQALLNLVMKEAIMIEGQLHGTSINGKEERGRGNLIRIQARRTE